MIRESPIVVTKATSALSDSKSQILPYLQDKELPACRTTAGTAWQCLLQVAEECACQKGAGAFVMLSCDWKSMWFSFAIYSDLVLLSMALAEAFGSAGSHALHNSRKARVCNKD